jgi:ABC-type branched-subunit amino acid transport system permease subunit
VGQNAVVAKLVAQLIGVDPDGIRVDAYALGAYVGGGAGAILPIHPSA